ncbi:MAG TPA: hypothetical protein VHY32_03030 [Caulobacteraceae bacterium]|nr:hypothetical protein [Caulobacteraceae bacterium]
MAARRSTPSRLSLIIDGAVLVLPLVAGAITAGFRRAVGVTG